MSLEIAVRGGSSNGGTGPGGFSGIAVWRDFQQRVNAIDSVEDVRQIIRDAENAKEIMSHIYSIILQKIRTDVFNMRGKRYTTLNTSDYAEIHEMVIGEFNEMHKALMDESNPKDNPVAKRVEAVIPYYEKLITTYARLKDIPEQTDHQNPEVFSIHDISPESDNVDVLTLILPKVQKLRQDAKYYRTKVNHLKATLKNSKGSIASLRNPQTTRAASSSNEKDLSDSSTESEGDEDEDKTAEDYFEELKKRREENFKLFGELKGLRVEKLKLKTARRLQRNRPTPDVPNAELSESDPDISSGDER